MYTKYTKKREENIENKKSIQNRNYIGKKKRIYRNKIYTKKKHI